MGYILLLVYFNKIIEQFSNFDKKDFFEKFITSMK